MLSKHMIFLFCSLIALTNVVFSETCFADSPNISGYIEVLKAYDAYRKYADECNARIKTYYKEYQGQNVGGWFKREYKELTKVRQESDALCKLAKRVNRGGSVDNLQWAIDYLDQRWDRMLKQPTLDALFKEIFVNGWISQTIVDADDLVDAFAYNNNIDSETQEKLRKKYLSK